MRIAIITATPASVAEGSGTYVAAERLATELVTRGHETYTIRPGWPLLPSLVRRMVFNRGLMTARVRRACGGDLPDVVLGFDMDGYRLAGSIPRPFFAYLHGVIADEASFERGVTGRILLYQAARERLAARRATKVLAPSEYSRRRIAEVYGVDPGRIVVVPPPVDVRTWQHDIAAAQTPARSPGPVVLAVAHLYPRKNVITLVRAARLLLERWPALTVRVVGTGPERPALARAIKRLGLARSVLLLGHVDRKQLVQEYAACDVFCLPSRQEGFGIAFVEAMAAGKPVVALNATSTPELITDGANGLLTLDDPAALAEALGRLFVDKALAARMGAANRQAALRWDAPRSVERLLEAVG